MNDQAGHGYLRQNQWQLSLGRTGIRHSGPMHKPLQLIGNTVLDPKQLDLKHQCRLGRNDRRMSSRTWNQRARHYTHRRPCHGGWSVYASPQHTCRASLVPNLESLDRLRLQSAPPPTRLTGKVEWLIAIKRRVKLASILLKGTCVATPQRGSTCNSLHGQLVPVAGFNNTVVGLVLDSNLELIRRLGSRSQRQRSDEGE